MTTGTAFLFGILIAAAISVLSLILHRINPDFGKTETQLNYEKDKQEVLKLQIQLASVDEIEQIEAFVLLRTIKWGSDNAYDVNQILHEFLMKQDKKKRAKFRKIAAEADRLSGRNKIRKFTWTEISIAVGGMIVALSVIVFLR